MNSEFRKLFHKGQASTSPKLALEFISIPELQQQPSSSTLLNSFTSSSEFSPTFVRDSDLERVTPSSSRKSEASYKKQSQDVLGKREADYSVYITSPQKKDIPVRTDKYTSIKDKHKSVQSSYKQAKVYRNASSSSRKALSSQETNVNDISVPRKFLKVEQPKINNFYYGCKEVVYQPEDQPPQFRPVYKRPCESNLPKDYKKYASYHITNLPELMNSKHQDCGIYTA